MGIFNKVVNLAQNTYFKILKNQIGQIHYIGGSEVLPAPLSKEEENELLMQMIEYPDDDEKINEIKKILIERNLRLVVYIAKKFENTNKGMEDLISIGSIGLIKAINTFKPDKKIKLATYASRCIENEILMDIRRTNKLKVEVSIDEPLNTDWDGNELLLSDILGTDFDSVYRNIEDEVDKALLNTALGQLSTREREIVELRYGFKNEGKEKTQKEVADMLGISQSYISRLEKKIIGRLKKEMKKMS
ncbi:RNA polymerase sporulation sigma factor SigE [Epulopiscium sp. 'N.t. morphotype B']|uniref:RNA polymerase sporulation sigma factor SigE n=1 Tax=Candidatus Epulonipiscium viviparus TaxID=420336 RepID=UPI00016C0A49